MIEIRKEVASRTEIQMMISGRMRMDATASLLLSRVTPPPRAHHIIRQRTATPALILTLLVLSTRTFGLVIRVSVRFLRHRILFSGTFQ